MLTRLLQEQIVALLSRPFTDRARMEAIFADFRAFLNPELCWELAAPDWDWSASFTALVRLNRSLQNKSSPLKALRDPFWIDLMCLIRQRQTGFNWQLEDERRDQLERALIEPLPDGKKKLPEFSDQLVDLLLLPTLVEWPEASGSKSGLALERVNEDYARWNQRISYSVGKAQTVDRAYKVQTLYHLLAWLLGMYYQQSGASSRIKPALVVVLRRFCQLEPGSFDKHSLFGNKGLHSGYTAVRRLIERSAAQLSEQESVQLVRNEIHKHIYAPDSEAEPLDHFIYTSINNFISKHRAMARIDGYLHDYQEHRITYSPIAFNRHFQPGPSAVGPDSPGLDWYYLRDEKNTFPLTPPTVTSGDYAKDASIQRGRINTDKAFFEHCAYSAKARDFWAQSPPLTMLNRQGIAEQFETLWIPEGEILLYALIDQCLDREGDYMSLILAHFGGEAPDAARVAKLESLTDACERLIIPCRTIHNSNSQDSEQVLRLRFLAWCLFPGFKQANALQTLQHNCKRLHERDWDSFLSEDPSVFCRPDSADWLQSLSREQFFKNICPFPAYLYEQIIRRQSRYLMHSFLLPLIYEPPQQQVLKQDYIPAAFLTGESYETPLVSERCLPFVSALWKQSPIAISQLARYLIDSQLTQIRHEQAIQTSVARRFGLLNSQVLKHLFWKDEVLGTLTGADGRASEVKAVHRPRDIDPEHLPAYLRYAGSGSLEPGWEPEADFLGLLYRGWTETRERDQHDPDTLRQSARRYFSWLKLQTYDAGSQEDKGHVLRMAQLFQTLWLADGRLRHLESQGRLDFRPPVFEVRIGSERLKSNGPVWPAPRKGLKGILDNQRLLKLLAGCPFDASFANTREIGLKAPLAGPLSVLELCAHVLDLLTVHLIQAKQSHVRVKSVNLDYDAGRQAFRLAIDCWNHFPSAVKRSLNQRERYGDFRRPLQQLALALSPEQTDIAFFSRASAALPVASQVCPAGLSIHDSFDSLDPSREMTRICLANKDWQATHT